MLLLAGSVSHGNLHEAVEAGATGFIPKPFFNPSLSEQVTSLIASIPYAPLYEEDFGDLEDPETVHVFACGAAITKHQRHAAQEAGVEPTPRFMEGVERIMHTLEIGKPRFKSEEFG